MKRILKATVLLLTVMLLSSCQEHKRELDMPNLELTTDYLIPHPLEVTATNSSFPLDRYTAITTDKGLEDVGLFLSEKITAKTNLKVEVNPSEMKLIETIISIELETDFENDNPEAYKLSIGEDKITLHAASAAGAFRGIQTIRQLIPEQSNDSLEVYSIWTIPTGEISDAPQFVFRSAMLDVARHFFSVDDVKAAIAEIWRVLKPGGVFIFIDHVKPEKERLVSIFQSFNGVWHDMAGGCNLLNESHKEIEKSRFFMVERGNSNNGVLQWGVGRKT